MIALRKIGMALSILLPVSVAAETDAVSYGVSGKYFDARDVPTYRIVPDGRTDWYTAHGFDAYRATCESCHGARGTGSDYGKDLQQVVGNLSYFDFMDAVVNGQIVQTGTGMSLMPAFGTNLTVMCSLDAIYVYLRAERAKALSTVPPEPVETNPKAEADLAACLGG